MNYSELSDEELIKLYNETKIEISNYDVFQLNIKILLNSLYGSLANKHSRFFNPKNAEAITLTGQLVITWVERKLNTFLSQFLKKEKDYVIAMDTDSCMVDFSGVVDLFSEKLNIKTEEEMINALALLTDQKLNSFLDQWYLELKDIMNFYKHKLHMKRECIASAGFYTTKKRYALKVHDSEGVRYTKPKLKIVGLETERSNVPKYFRNKLKEAFELIFTGNNNDVINFLNKIKADIREQNIEDIAFNSSVSNIEKYFRVSDNIKGSYSKGTPIHVRASIIYNLYIEKLNLSRKYEPITSGEKIKYIYLRTPNPINEDVIAFRESFPEEFNLKKYIDYEMQFEKSFEKPLQGVLNCFGWSTKKINRLF